MQGSRLFPRIDRRFAEKFGCFPVRFTVKRIFGIFSGSYFAFRCYNFINESGGADLIFNNRSKLIFPLYQK